MPVSKRKEPEVLPGADPESDCQTPEDEIGLIGVGEQHDDYDEDDHEHDVTWSDVEGETAVSVQRINNWIPVRAAWSKFLEKIALIIERPVNAFTGATQLNPFYHTGTIAVFLMIVVALTGFYLFLFFQYGFDASYNAVLTRIEGQFIARIVRAIHRYASGALVITTLLHAYRTLFMERFRGPRWLAWLTGILMTFLLWLAGVTGYWLVWDVRAQVINEAFVNFLETTTPFAPAFMALLAKAESSGVSWPLFLSVLAAHIILFLVVAFFFWLHIRRLNRAKWLPQAHWVVMIGVLILLVSALFPIGMLAQADTGWLPQFITFDPIFLFYLPFINNPVLSGLLWGGLIVVTVLTALLPWSSKDRRTSGESQNGTAEKRPFPPRVNIIKERCTGCTKCALDCPYDAIKMVERHDGKPHKFIAIEDPSLCVSCGICVGSCDGVAVTMGNTPPIMLWEMVQSQLALARLRSPANQLKVVFTCERHAVHGARPYIEHIANLPDGLALEVITLPCVGAAPPDLLTRTLDAGAAEVQVVGCPPDDCVNREGNLWAEQRLVRERVPRLKRAYANAPITAAWLPPDAFAAALNMKLETPAGKNGDNGDVDFLDQRRMYRELSLRNFIPAFLLLAFVLVAQILLTDLPLRPYPQNLSVAQIVIADLTQPIGRNSYISTTLSPEVELQFIVDNEPLYTESWTTTELLAADSVPFYLAENLPPGPHHLRLALVDPAAGITFVYFDNAVMLDEGQVFRIE